MFQKFPYSTYKGTDSLILLLLNVCLKKEFEKNVEFFSPFGPAVWPAIGNIYIYIRMSCFVLNICLNPSPWFYSFLTYVYTPLLGSSLIEHIFKLLSLVLLLLNICVLRIPDCTEYHQLCRYERVGAQSARVSEHQVRVTKPQVRVIRQISRVK